MYRKMIKFTDFDGNEREEPFYFNLTKAEVVKWEGMTKGGLKQLMENIVQTQDQAALIKIFEQIIDKSYGEKSPDGKYFRKNAQILEDFKSTAAYSVLFMELASNDESAAEFVNGIIPEDLLEAAREAKAEEERQSKAVKPATIASENSFVK